MRATEAALSNVQKVSVALTPEMVAMLREVDELRALWAEGLASGPPVKGQPIFQRLREKYARQAAEK